MGDGANSVVGGLGNDRLRTGIGNDVVIGNEGNDCIYAHDGADTMTGGSGNDTFFFTSVGEDNNASAGGLIDTITDLDWTDDDVHLNGVTPNFARNYGAAFASQGTLASAASAAASTAFVDGGASAGTRDAAQFTYGGRTYLLVEAASFGSFVDIDDLLVDITGATGTISTTHLV